MGKNTLILHPVYIHNIVVEGKIQQVCGDASDPQLFPRQPFTFDIDYEDFTDKEEYQTVLRILTQVSRQKVQTLISSKKIVLE